MTEPIRKHSQRSGPPDKGAKEGRAKVSSKTRTGLNLHLVSDTPNESLAEARRIASALYPGVEIIEYLHPPVLSFADLEIALRHIERHRGIVLYLSLIHI